VVVCMQREAGSPFAIRCRTPPVLRRFVLRRTRQVFNYRFDPAKPEYHGARFFTLCTQHVMVTFRMTPVTRNEEVLLSVLQQWFEAAKDAGMKWRCTDVTKPTASCMTLTDSEVILRVPLKLLVPDVLEYSETIKQDGLTWQVMVTYDRQGRDRHINVTCQNAARTYVEERIMEYFDHVNSILDGVELDKKDICEPFQELLSQYMRKPAWYQLSDGTVVYEDLSYGKYLKKKLVLTDEEGDMIRGLMSSIVENHEDFPQRQKELVQMIAGRYYIDVPPNVIADLDDKIQEMADLQRDLAAAEDDAVADGFTFTDGTASSSAAPKSKAKGKPKAKAFARRFT
jgi:hypothetical protein